MTPRSFTIDVGKSIPFRAVIYAAFVALSVLMTGAGCTKEKDQSVPASDGTAGNASALISDKQAIPALQQPKYQGWTSTASGLVVLYYPKTHQHAAEMPAVADGYVKAITTVTERLGAQFPSDTVRVYCYTGPGQGQEMTGQPLPFADSTGIHYWPNHSRGVSLMKYLLPRIYGTDSRLPIMRHGLIACFDYAHENYHRTTLSYAKDTFFIPLAKLAVDTAMNSDVERYQSAEAASFVGFLLGQYGPPVVRSIYLSDLPFDATVASACGISVDSLQKEWMDYVRVAAGDTLQAAAPRQ